MKFLFTHRLPLFLCSLASALAQAQQPETTTFSQPAEYCFWQTELRGNLEKTILEHHLLVDAEDHFKTGDVFVAATFKSQPGKIMLTNGIGWYNLDKPGPLPTVNGYNAGFQAISQLQPVVPISVFFTPADIRPFANDAQILVGYGLRAEDESNRVAFDEMLSSKRYDVLWEPGKPGIGIGGISYKICMTATGMKRNTLVVRVGDSSPFGDTVAGPVGEIERAR